MGLHYWVVRPNPSGILRIEEFLQGRIIAVGWLRDHDYTEKTEQVLAELLAKERPEAKKQARKLQLGMIKRFVYEIKVDDVVMVPTVERIFIGKVCGDYFYNEAKAQAGYPHQRPVRWLSAEGVPRGDLQGQIRGAFRPQLAIYSLDKYKPQVQELIQHATGSFESQALRQRELELCHELTEEAYHSLKDALKSDDPELRIRAIELILEQRKQLMEFKLSRRDC